MLEAAGCSGRRVKILDVVDAARVVLVLGRVAVQGVGGGLIEEQHPVTRLAEVLDNSRAAALQKAFFRLFGLPPG